MLFDLNYWIFKINFVDLGRNYITELIFSA
jgi:hypothetical protein